MGTYEAKRSGGTIRLSMEQPSERSPVAEQCRLQCSYVRDLGFEGDGRIKLKIAQNEENYHSFGLLRPIWLILL